MGLTRHTSGNDAQIGARAAEIRPIAIRKVEGPQQIKRSRQRCSALVNRDAVHIQPDRSRGIDTKLRTQVAAAVAPDVQAALVQLRKGAPYPGHRAGGHLSPALRFRMAQPVDDAQSHEVRVRPKLHPSRRYGRRYQPIPSPEVHRRLWHARQRRSTRGLVAPFESGVQACRERPVCGHQETVPELPTVCCA